MRTALKIFVISLVTILAGCGGPPPPPVDNVYTGLSENLPRLDPSILSGRRILIDPGHGGHFRGTLGQDGLEESQVNMGVALYLWGLLREAGADVHLTRSAERDFLAVDDSTLVTDLATRVAMVDSLEPDILVSIHHNAQPQRDPSTNAVETYYRFGDPGSRDLAFAVHRHLMRNLGIDNGEVKPGNYYILRNIDVPAILGEGSYLTHPNVEAALERSSKQRLEAEAYFLGILEYFSRGTPRLEVAAPADSILDTVPLLAFAASDVGGLGIDPAGIELTINEGRVEAQLNQRGDRILYRMPWDSPNGDYDVALGVRNILGNASRFHRLKFRVDLPPTGAAFETTPGLLPSGSGTVRVRARLLDRRGLPVADGTGARVRSEDATVPDSVFVDKGFIEFPAIVDSAAPRARIVLMSRGAEFEVVVNRGNDPAGRFRRVVLADASSGRPIHDVTVMVDDSLVAAGSHSGTYFLPADGVGPGQSIWFSAPGYRPTVIDSANAWSDTLHLAPWYEGALAGTRFVLDPEGGFSEASGRGQLGLSGSHANLQVARYAAEYLRAAGAAVTLTRTTEQTLSPRDVVDLTNRFGATRYVEIRHRNAPADSALRVDCFFFPGSVTGNAMAGTVQNAIATSLQLDTRVPRDVVTFPLQQTACPAMVVEYPSIGDMEEELRLAEPWYQRVQGYALFTGILEHFGVPVDSVLTVRVINEQAGPANWLVTVDRTWNMLTGPDGIIEFAALGRYTPELVEIRRGDVHIVRRIQDVDGSPITFVTP